MERLELTSRDGTRLSAVHWPVEGGDPLLLVGGLAEHAGRYEELAGRLNEAGWDVLQVELRGHGQSSGKPGHVDRWEDYVDDVRAGLARLGGKPVLLAHSMGGLVSLDLLRTDEASFRAVALSGPLLAPYEPPALPLRAALRVLDRVLPSLSLDNGLPPERVATDPAIVEAYIADPLVFSTITPRWYRQMKQAQTRVFAHAADYRLPLYLVWGSDDRICSPAAMVRFVDQYGGPHTTRSWVGAYHEVFNDLRRTEVVDALVEWLAQHHTAD